MCVFLKKTSDKSDTSDSSDTDSVLNVLCLKKILIFIYRQTIEPNSSVNIHIFADTGKKREIYFL